MSCVNKGESIDKITIPYIYVLFHLLHISGRKIDVDIIESITLCGSLKLIKKKIINAFSTMKDKLIPVELKNRIHIMTLSEMLEIDNKNKISQRHDNEEHRLQVSCVRWFRMQYPNLKNVLFAVPNAARRSQRMGVYMKEEGMLPGVADLILLKNNHSYNTLCIEMKTSQGVQSYTQKKWQTSVEYNGNKYILCRSLENFIQEINDYLMTDKR